MGEHRVDLLLRDALGMMARVRLDGTECRCGHFFYEHWLDGESTEEDDRVRPGNGCQTCDTDCDCAAFEFLA